MDHAQPHDHPHHGDDDNELHPFCNGMSMIMAMGGFQWSVVGKQAGDCITYFVPGWKLDSIGKFQGAIIYTFLLAVLTEGLTTLSHRVRGGGRERRRYPRRILLALLYAFHQCLGYILMLVTMTFSIELFASVIVGVMMGRVLFRSNNVPKARTSATPHRQEPSPRQGSENESMPLLEETTTTSSSSHSNSWSVRRRRNQET